MQQLSDEAITLQGDTLQATLPKVTLLDKDFIDEAKTKSFYESGKWTPQAHQPTRPSTKKPTAKCSPIVLQKRM